MQQDITANEIVEIIMYNDAPEANTLLRQFGLLSRDITDSLVEIYSLRDGTLVHTLEFGVYLTSPDSEEEVPATPEVTTEDPAPLASLMRPTPLADLIGIKTKPNTRSMEFREALDEALKEDEDSIDADILARLRERALREAIQNAVADSNGGGMVNSTSDDRVVNNAVRHQYRILNEDEKANMQEIKDIGLAFLEFIEAIENENGPTRELSIAKTKVEEAVMWATKSITR